MGNLFKKKCSKGGTEMKKEKSNDDVLKMRKFCEKHQCKTCPYFSKDEYNCFITYVRLQAEKEMRK